ncbi:MAG: PLDc N-terminal domain-containing protein [Armatimonadetes bacterium]|nr:PLDc N-terminal domain-containing protein [Armatimonadota bacterium]
MSGLRLHLMWGLLAACLYLPVTVMAQEAPEASPPPTQETSGEVTAPDDQSAAPAPAESDWESEIFGADAEGVDDAARAAAGIAAAGGLAVVGFVMVWFVLYFGFLAFIIAFSMASLVATILAVYDCARREFPDPNTRALWCILILLTRWIGALIYYLVVYRQAGPAVPSHSAAAPSIT